MRRGTVGARASRARLVVERTIDFFLNLRRGSARYASSALRQYLR